MKKTPSKEPRGAVISRRDVIRGAAAVVVIGAAGNVALAGTQRRSGHGAKATTGTMRYMAAAAMLGDGRVLLTGGYDRPFYGKGSPSAVNTATIYDPQSGTITAAAPMGIPRARHAAVALKDGRVAVIGGISANPTSSIEVYDPGSDTWTTSQPLAQPRYDHVAVADGDTVIVMGGISLAMMTGVEAVYPG